MALIRFQSGQSIIGFDFGNVLNNDINNDLYSFLGGLTYDSGTSTCVLLEGTIGGTTPCGLRAYKAEVNYTLYAYMGDQQLPVYDVTGYKNLTDGKFEFFGYTAVVDENGIHDTIPPTWNGVFVGADTGVTVEDTISAGTYDFSTGVWSDTADYSVTDNGDGSYSVTGEIPYGSANSLFSTDGYRCALKISRNTVDSSLSLPDGNICVITVGEEVFTYTKSAFETDGSLIYISAPQFGTLSTPRVVKIAWSMDGETLQESDFTTYTIDLSGATLVPHDTVIAGTYSAATGVWTDNADYTITDNGDGTYAVTGLIPYGRADSMFPFAGYRFAVKISRNSITSRNSLPDGTIVKITVGSEITQATKEAFETDGSLIYVAAPIEETLTTPRVVQIAWAIAGSTVQPSDFTSYTFDLSDAELAPIPEENEEESRVAYCLTPNLQSTKIVKVVAPSGGLRAGQVVNCVSLASAVDGIANNLDVYSPSLPTTATLGSNFYALIINGGFEELKDGRRPKGNPDFTTYVYNEGDICDAILLDKNLVFEISGSCISGDTSLNPIADIGRYIVPTNGTYVLSIANAPTAGGCLKIIGTSYFKKGGLFNNAYNPTYIALAIH